MIQNSSNFVWKLRRRTEGHYYFDPNKPGLRERPSFQPRQHGTEYSSRPGINNWDLSILETVQIYRVQNLEFRAEFFNAWNHAQFLNPDAQGSVRLSGRSPQQERRG